MESRQAWQGEMDFVEDAVWGSVEDELTEVPPMQTHPLSSGVKS